MQYVFVHKSLCTHTNSYTLDYVCLSLKRHLQIRYSVNIADCFCQGATSLC